MGMYKRPAVFTALIVSACLHLYAFESGFRLSLRANLTGSLSRPKISKADLKSLGSDEMKGMLGYVTTGEADLTYLFDSVRYFQSQSNVYFGGLGWCFSLSLGQGFTGQISGQYIEMDGRPEWRQVYCRVHMIPVLTVGSGIRSYFFKNKLAIGGTVSLRMPLDPQPTYEMYTDLSDTEVAQIQSTIDLRSGTGTLLITEEQMKKINPIGYVLRGLIEYNQPFVHNMEILLGMFLSYTIYKPKYVTMPRQLMDAAEKQSQKDLANTPINSFYMNSLDFGVHVGLNFKV